MVNDPKKFRIPKEFTLFGHRYSIIIEDDLFERENCYGTADDDEKVIRIQRKKTVIKTYEDGPDKIIKKVPIELTDETIVETYYHEIIHVVLDSLGEETISENEKLVNMMAKSFLEIYISSLYDMPDKKEEDGK